MTREQNTEDTRQIRHTMVIALPQAPETQNTENMVINDTNFDDEAGFQRPIIGTAMAVSTKAHKTITQSSSSI